MAGFVAGERAVRPLLLPVLDEVLLAHVLAGKGIGEIADYEEAIIRRLNRKPVISLAQLAFERLQSHPLRPLPMLRW